MFVEFALEAVAKQQSGEPVSVSDGSGLRIARLSKKAARFLSELNLR
jgi:hypothetical protein